MFGTALRLLVTLALLGFPAITAAQSDPFDGLDANLVAGAQAGNPYDMLNLGMALLAADRTEAAQRSALDLFTKAHAKATENPDALDLRLAGYALREMANAEKALSNFREALAYYEEAERLFRSFDATDEYNSMIAVLMEDRGIVLQDLSRYEEALPPLKIAYDWYLNQEPPQRRNAANVLLNAGTALERLKRYDEALDVYKWSTEVFIETDGKDSAAVGYLANNIGWVYVQTKRYTQAREWLENALRILEPLEGAMSYNVTILRINMSLVAVEEGKSEEAVRWGFLAMPYIAQNRQQTLAIQRWNFESLSRAFTMRGEPERAIFFGKLAVNAQQAIRASNAGDTAADTSALQEEWRRLYQSLADLLISQGRISEAQAVLNMEKEEEVFNYLKRDAQADITKTRATLNDKELSEQDKLDALAALPIAADAALRELTDKLGSTDLTEEEANQVFLLQDALQKSSDQFDAAVAAFLAEVAPDGKETLEKQFDATGSYQATLESLPRPTAILQIATLPDALHLFVTLPSLTLHQEVPITRADLARIVFDTLQAIEAVSPDAPEKLQALHKLVFAPVAQQLKDAGVEVVMLNLDGFLRYVPFAALYDGDHYLIEDFAFVQFTPAIETQFKRPDRTAAKTAGFGVTAPHPGFSALPGVRAELATIFGASAGQGVLNGTTALDASFDERSLKTTLLKAPEILHIASHFNLMPGQEDDSFLLLGDGEHLPLGKIRSTRALSFKGIDLLTLSACQTARGADGDGAEIDGFGTTAQLNGAGAVMASLWPVSDAATPKLMHDFYAGIMQNGLDKAEALRQAQIKMLRSNDAVADGTDRAAAALNAPEPAAKAGFDHPYFWSAFVLMGNWL
jgi:CHAT domain-containing protein/tetratricopeptide (TPR) repeat protein